LIYEQVINTTLLQVPELTQFRQSIYAKEIPERELRRFETMFENQYRQKGKYEYKLSVWLLQGSSKAVARGDESAKQQGVHHIFRHVQDSI
jgi:hypothetical protein